MPKPPEAYQYAITFENLSGVPRTLRGTVHARQIRTGVRLAMAAAMSQAPGQRWTSLSILMERET